MTNTVLNGGVSQERSNLGKHLNFFSMLYVIGVCAWIGIQSWFSWHGNQDRLLMISKKTQAEDAKLIEIAQQNSGGHFTYSSAFSKFGRGMLAQVKAPDSASLVLIVDPMPGGADFKVLSDPTSIRDKISSLSNTNEETRSKFYVYGIPIFVLWVGLLFRVGNFAPILFAATVGAMSSKLTTLCVICGEGGGASFYVSIAALVMSALGLAVSLLYKGSSTIYLIRTIATCIASGQLILLFANPTMSCNACLLGWMAIGPLAVSQQWSKVNQANWQRFGMRSLSILLGTICYFGLTNLSSVRQGANSTINLPKRQFSSLVGTNAYSGTLKLNPEKINVAEIVCLSRATCEPCQDAKRHFSKNREAKVRFVECLTRGARPTSEPSQFVPSSELSIQTPTFLVIGSDGTIISQMSGWSDDPDWIKAATQTLTDSLQLAEIGNNK